MSKPTPGEANDALDRALALVPTPEVPADLAARIVASATARPQLAPAQDLPARQPRAGRRLALAAAVAGVLVLGAAVLSGSLTGERAREAAAGRPEATLLAAGPRHAPAPPPAAASAPAPAPAPAASAVREAAPARERATETPLPPSAPPLAPEISEPVVELAERPAEAAVVPTPAPSAVAAGGEPVGPVVEGSDGPDRPIVGPPAPTGLGIAGGKTSAPPTVPGITPPPRMRGTSPR